VILLFKHNYVGTSNTPIMYLKIQISIKIVTHDNLKNNNLNNEVVI